MFVEALRILLQSKYEVIGVVADGHTLVAEAIRLVPDILVVDVGMPFLNGFDAARQIKDKMPNMSVVFVTMQENPVMAAAAKELGAGFVLKLSSSSELLTAIEDVLHGKPYISARLKSDDWVAERARARLFTKDLTARQREIVQLCAEGRAIKEIASTLCLSEKTVEFHKHNIMGTYGIKNNAELVLFALKLGLISMNSSLDHRSPGTSSFRENH